MQDHLITWANNVPKKGKLLLAKPHDPTLVTRAALGLWGLYLYSSVENRLGFAIKSRAQLDFFLRMACRHTLKADNTPLMMEHEDRVLLIFQDHTCLIGKRKNDFIDLYPGILHLRTRTQMMTFGEERCCAQLKYLSRGGPKLRVTPEANLKLGRAYAQSDINVENGAVLQALRTNIARFDITWPDISNSISTSAPTSWPAILPWRHKYKRDEILTQDLDDVCAWIAGTGALKSEIKHPRFGLNKTQLHLEVQYENRIRTFNLEQVAADFPTTRAALAPLLKLNEGFSFRLTHGERIIKKPSPAHDFSHTPSVIDSAHRLVALTAKFGENGDLDRI